MQFYKPAINRMDMESVLMSMADEAVGPGDRMKEFKKELSQFIGFRNTICIRSFPNAIMQAFDMLGLSEGDGLLVSCFSDPLYKFLADEVGLNTVVVDVDENGVAVLPEKCDGIKAALVSDCYLRFPDFSKYAEKDIRVICDISDAIGAEIDVDGIDVAVVSLEDDRIISAAGGACVMSNKYKPEKPLVLETLSDLNAAMSLQQLNNFDHYLEKRREYRMGYINAVQVTGNRIFSYHSEEKKDNAFRFAVYLENFKECLKFLEKKKIPVRKAFEDTLFSQLEDKDRYRSALPLYSKVYEFPLYYFLKKDEAELVRKTLQVLP